MKKFVVAMITLLSATSSFAETLSCKTAMQAFKLVGDKDGVVLVLNDNANNNPNKVILKGKVTTITQEGKQTVFSYNPWNIEIRINELDKDLDLYDGTIEFYQPKANNPVMNINCVKTR